MLAAWYPERASSIRWPADLCWHSKCHLLCV